MTFEPAFTAQGLGRIGNKNNGHDYVARDSVLLTVQQVAINLDMEFGKKLKVRWCTIALANSSPSD